MPPGGAPPGAEGDKSVSDTETPPHLTQREIQSFQRLVREYYDRAGRTFPWRETTDPYRILVSELMLQQTQTARVVEKYVRFVDTLPDVSSLADVSTHEVLTLWQGLGYNRRALYLKKAAAVIVRDFNGIIPNSEKFLLSLPGVGPATAGAVRAFAFNEPSVFVETNIRSVFIHHFFEGRDAVTDREILPLVEATLDRKNPRTWYWGLMDYGVHLKESKGNPAARSAHHTTQSPFRGSDREIRGAVLALLVEKEVVTKEDILARFPGETKRVERIVADLQQEGFLDIRGNKIIARGD